MTQRNYDPEFEQILSLLPTVTDFSSVETIQTMREARAELGRALACADIDYSAASRPNRLVHARDEFFRPRLDARQVRSSKERSAQF